MTTDLWAIHDHTVSQRFFWYPASSIDWWPLICLAGIRGGDENCNRTIGIRLPGGMLMICLNAPLRQKPCPTCLKEWHSWSAR